MLTVKQIVELKNIYAERTRDIKGFDSHQEGFLKDLKESMHDSYKEIDFEEFRACFELEVLRASKKKFFRLLKNYIN